jgi:hypothetical protein
MILAELSTKSRKAAEGEENQSALLAPQLSFSKSRMAFDAHPPPHKIEPIAVARTKSFLMTLNINLE